MGNKALRYLYLPLYLVVLCFLIGIALLTGPFDISLNDIKDAVLNYQSDNRIHFVIIHLRMPRIVLALLVGGALAISGYLLQAMVNNPLAEPYILGTASGASLGVNVGYMLLSPLMSIGLLSVSLFGFAGAMLVTLIAIAVATRKGIIFPDRLLLAGIALSSMSVSLISLMIYLSDNDNKLRSVVYWSLGSLDKAQWSQIPLLAVALIIFAVIFSFLTKHLNIMLLGESRSVSLGLNIKALRWQILSASALLTAFAVAVAGPIGFVGLMIPHLVRALFGIHAKFNVLNSILLGGIYLLTCDIISRWVYPPAGIPIGIITSFLGVPFFVYLLSKRNYRFS